MEGKGGDLEAEAAEGQDHAEEKEGMPILERGRHSGEVGRLRDAVHEGQAVGDEGRGHRADEEELERRLHRLFFSLAEARHHVEGDGHELEGHEDEDELTRGGQHEHAEERAEHQHVVFSRPSREGRRAKREGAQHAENRGKKVQKFKIAGQ